MATPLRFMRGSGRDGRPSMLDVWMTTAHVLASATMPALAAA